MRNPTVMNKTIIAAMAILWSMLASAQRVTWPFPEATELITEQPEGDVAWYSRTCTKYMHLLGPFEYGGETSAPTKTVSSSDGNFYIGGLFTDFENAGWLKGTTGLDSKDIVIKFPQIIYDEEYKDGKHYYYYACAMRLNEEMTDLDLADSQKITLHRDENGNLKPTDPDIAIGVCYVVDPASGEMPPATGYEGCTLDWFGIAYGNITMETVDTETHSLPEGAEKKQYALTHSSNGMFVNLAVDNGKVYISGIWKDNPDACIVGDIDADGKTVTFPTNQFMGVAASGDYFYYMVAAAPEDVEDSETGSVVHTIGPSELFRAEWNAEKQTLSFMDPETGFAISNGQSKVGGGDLYLEPRLNPQEKYVEDTPVEPEIIAYNPYSDEQGYGTINFNLPFWNADGLLIDQDNIFYNIYFDNQLQVLSPETYLSLGEDISDIPYNFKDNYDIFHAGINHAVYLYSGNYNRVGIQSFTRINGVEYKSPIVYTVNTAIDSVDEAGKKVVETCYYDLSGRRIDVPATGFAVKCLRFEDGTVKTEKIMKASKR